MEGCDLPGSRDPAIKLFGRKIPLLESQIPSKPKSIEPNQAKDSRSVEGEDKVLSEPNNKGANFIPKENQAENNSTEEEKVFKKPDKILPCPRCNSLDTKFCYFNNYNVNQPRHFCKNCQRYWTAGGTMRNVPVGAGRRKNKQFASQYRQMFVAPDGTPINRIETSDSASHRLVSPTGNGTVLNFGPEQPLSESMDTMLKLGDETKCTMLSNVTCEGQEREISARRSSSVTVSAGCCSDRPVNALPTGCIEENAQNSLPFYPVPPWGYPLNPGWTNVAAVTPNGKNPNPIQFCPAPVVAIPGVFPPNIPLQFVPASYLSCRPVLGNLSLSASNGSCLSPSSSTSNSCCSGSGGSPTLGKHLRDPSSTEETQSEKYVLVTKTLRIADPDEASKSPILWTSLGILPDHEPKSMSFKGLETQGEGSQLLEANPAALSCSHTFQEGI